MLPQWFDSLPASMEAALPPDRCIAVMPEVGALCNSISRLVEAATRDDEDPALEPDVLGALFDGGLFSLTVPSEHGGFGASMRDFVVVMEQLGKLGPAWAMTAVPHLCISVKSVARLCTSDVRDAILRDIRTRSRLIAFAITEDHGSDVAAMCTRLRKAPDGRLVLSGRKQWITNLARASHVVVAALCPDLHPAPGASILVLVPLPQRGVKVSPAWDKMCANGSDTAEIFFDDTPIAPENLLSEPGQGMSLFLEMVQPGRLGAAAAANGLALAALHAASEDATHSLSGAKCRELQAMLDAAGASIRLCAAFGDAQHPDFPSLVSLLKHACGELAQTAIQQIDAAYAVDGRLAPPAVALAREALGLFRLLKGPGDILALQTVLSWATRMHTHCRGGAQWPQELRAGLALLARRFAELREGASPAAQPAAAMQLADGLARWWLVLSAHNLPLDAATALSATRLEDTLHWTQRTFAAWCAQSKAPLALPNSARIDTFYNHARYHADRLFRIKVEKWA